ncbi:DUF350 domain-containing protein [Clostridium intestinale]|uniref:DUF350 domain-containing protein n=1 Tax=Clostridium intestinale URNW TaxID=1294142 RepID=U2N9A2_9CLOT|nr:DUF350 domain-containing protein [Clostridium intestinale]ERK32062.1 hypothetical protein CINTURNW_0588 [Clostridium intestinale URNW]
MDILINVGLSFLFGVVGIAIMLIGYVLFDKVIKADFDKELEKGNIAVAIVVAGVLIAIGIIVSQVIA